MDDSIGSENSVGSDVWQSGLSSYALSERLFMQRLLFAGIRPSVLLLCRQRALNMVANRRRLHVDNFDSDDDFLPLLGDSDDDSLPPLVHPYEDSDFDVPIMLQVD